MAAAGRPDTDQNHAGATLRIERRAGGVAWVTMAREAVFNAFDEALIAELDAAFATLGADAGVRVVVLAGAGRHFSAGADLKWMQRAAAASREANEADAQRFAAMLAQIVQCPKPTVARIQGAALGGGVGLACACDIAIAADDAHFAVSEVKFGILPAVIGPHLVNAVGRRQAQRLSLTAERIGAAEALAIGLVQRVVPAAELDAAVEATVQALRVGGPHAQTEVKQLFAQLHPGPITPEVRTLTARTIARVRGGAEAREGFDAFLAKRPPAWMVNEPEAD
jgi:methylglutaconyl-CoA hydratase